MASDAAGHSFARTFADVGRALRPVAVTFRVRDERSSDVAAREGVLDACFGPARFTKTCERLREGRSPADGLSLVATDGGKVVGTVRFWHIEAGDRPALLLGPVAVAASHRSRGIAAALIEHGLRRARRLGHAAVLLVGDAPYYGRFGFTRAVTLPFSLPGPVDEARFLGLELVPGALDGAGGRVVGAGELLPRRMNGPARLAA